MTTTATLTANDRCLSDFHKDAYGFRPSPAQYARWATMTDAELDAEEASLQAAIEASIREEIEAENAAAVAYEAHLAKLQANYGIDRATAIRWDIESLGIGDDIKVYGMETYCYEHGLATDYFSSRK
jgi:hypothetical protein